MLTRVYDFFCIHLSMEKKTAKLRCVMKIFFDANVKGDKVKFFMSQQLLNVIFKVCLWKCVCCVLVVKSGVMTRGFNQDNREKNSV